VLEIIGAPGTIRTSDPQIVTTPIDQSLLSIFDHIHDKLVLQNDLRFLKPDTITKIMADNFDDACRLIYHIARGDFPKFRKPEGPYNPRKVATRGY